MKQTVVIHSGYYEMLTLSSILNHVDSKVNLFTSLNEFYESGIGMSVDCIIIEINNNVENFNSVIKFIRRMDFLYKPPRVIVITKIEQYDRLTRLVEENIDMLISEQEELTVLRKMLITGVVDLNYQMTISPYLNRKKNEVFHPARMCLTSMEREVLCEIKSMKTNSGVAQKMGKSSKTISTHKRNAMKKLGLKNSIDLYKYLMQ